MGWTALMLVPRVEHGVSPRAWTFTSCTPGIAATGENCACDRVFECRKFEVRENARPSAQFPNGLRACGRKQLALPILEHAYEIANLFGNFSAEDNESKSRARSGCCVDGRRSSTFLGQLHQLEPDLAHAAWIRTGFGDG